MGAEQTRLQQQERDRAEALAAILGSDAAKKLVVAGPGAGKTHTFRQALLACGGRGLALTFIRNLVADLEDALGDIADVSRSTASASTRSTVGGRLHRWPWV